MNDNLKSEAASGIAWNALAQFVTYAIQMVSSVILARILRPHDYGLMGMIGVFSGLIIMVADGGIEGALIQKKEVVESQWSVSFWMTLLLGCVFALIFFLLTPLIANFFCEKILRSIGVLIAVNFLIRALSIVPLAKLRKEIQFNKIAIIQILSVFIANGVVITLALMHLGVWSLAFNTVVLALCNFIFSWIATRWRPTFKLNYSTIKELLNVGGHMTGAVVVGYAQNNSDSLLIGKFMGAEFLGIYSRAQGIMLFPAVQVTNVLGFVMFPVLAKIQDDIERFKRVYLQSIAIIALFTFPMCLGMLVVADNFILGVYGSQWEAAIPLLRFFCVMRLIDSVSATVWWIYACRGKADWMFRWGLVTSTTIIGSFFIGTMTGSLRAVVIGNAIAILLLLYPSFVIPGKLINLTFREVLKTLAPIMGISLLMAGIIEGVGFILPKEWPQLLDLAIKGGLGAFLYVGLLRILRIKPYLYLVDFIKNHPFFPLKLLDEFKKGGNL